MDAPEARRRRTNLDVLEAFFKARPSQWIEARDLEAPGGRQAWRSRVSECRTKRGMTIEHREERTFRAGEVILVRSYYRYLPYTPIGPDASEPRERSLFNGDPAGERR